MSLSESFNFAISKLLIPLSRIKISYSVRSISTSEEVSSRARLNLYPDLNFQNSSIHGQGFDDAGLIPSDSRHTFISFVNLPGAMSEDTDQYFTISCSDFKKFFDALSVLDIGDEVSEKNINQTILDDVENIFDTYAGNCTQLDEYEFE